mgnify:CR=1 FL=1
MNKSITSKNNGVRLSAHNQHITIVTGTPQEQDKNTLESRFSDSQLQTRHKNNNAAGESESTFLLGLVKDFWQYSKAILYPEMLFSKPEETEILNLIWASVYQKFKISGSRKDWKNYQKILYQRIDMVHRWLVRNPNRWVAPPHLYFSIENKRNGFNKTYHWYLKQEILKREIRNQILIQKTNQEWKDHTKGKGKLKHKTRLQLFNIQQQRLATYNVRVYHQNLERNLNCKL